MTKDRRNEIRCICSRKPLLATYGLLSTGKPYIHVKVFKQSRIYGEIFVSADADVRIRCRECLRLQKVKIISGRPQLVEQDDKKSNGAVADVDRLDVEPSALDG